MHEMEIIRWYTEYECISCSCAQFSCASQYCRTRGWFRYRTRNRGFIREAPPLNTIEVVFPWCKSSGNFKLINLYNYLLSLFEVTELCYLHMEDTLIFLHRGFTDFSNGRVRHAPPYLGVQAIHLSFPFNLSSEVIDARLGRTCRCSLISLCYEHEHNLCTNFINRYRGCMSAGWYCNDGFGDLTCRMLELKHRHLILSCHLLGIGVCATGARYRFYIDRLNMTTCVPRQGYYCKAAGTTSDCEDMNISLSA